MISLRIASDLHLEGFVGRNINLLADLFIPPTEKDSSSYLVLAGDISSNTKQLVEFLEEVSKRFAGVFYVPGNHEFYKKTMNYWFIEVNEELKKIPNLYYVLDSAKAFNVEGTKFILSTLWGDGGYSLQDQAKIGFYMYDFRGLITTGDAYTRFTVFDMIRLYKRNAAMIESLLTSDDLPKVVITHHMPSRRLISPRFIEADGSDGANGGFVGNCENMIARTEIAPKLWIHGHTHDTIDTSLWNTRIVCNPAGYRSEYASQFNKFHIVGEDKKIIAANPMFVEV